MKKVAFALGIILSLFFLVSCNKTRVIRQVPAPPGGSVPPNTPPPPPANQDPVIGARDDADDPYVKPPGGRQLTINGSFNEFAPVLGVYTYNQQNELLQVTEFGALFRNFVFTYDAQGVRHHNRWVYIYDAGGAIQKIEISTPTLTRTYNVTPDRLLEYTETRDSESFDYKYEYSSSGDPTQITCLHTFRGLVHHFVYNLTYTEDVSSLNNDPMFHFANLSLWFNIPIVSRHLPGTVTYLDYDGSNNVFDWSSFENQLNRYLIFQYAFDEKGRPTSVLIYDMMLSSNLLGHCEIRYP